MRRNRRSSCLSPDISCSSDRQGSLVILPRLSCFDLTRLPLPPLSPVELSSPPILRLRFRSTFPLFPFLPEASASRLSHSAKIQHWVITYHKHFE